jgi:hypothetical protein
MRHWLMTLGTVAAIVAAVCFVFINPAFAQLNNGQEESVVAAHAQAHNTKGISCSNWDPNMSCIDFVTAWPIQSGADVYFIVANADSALGVSGVSLGVDYGDTPGVTQDGVGCDVFGYTFCSDLEYTNGVGDVTTEFPAAGGGNRLIWVRTTNCQRHVVYPYKVEAVACVFYVYAYGPDQFIVDMNRNLYTGAEFQMVDCPGPALSDMAWPSRAGVVEFGGGPGYNPCSIIVPVENTTWGKLKSQYN